MKPVYSPQKDIKCESKVVRVHVPCSRAVKQVSSEITSSLQTKLKPLVRESFAPIFENLKEMERSSLISTDQVDKDEQQPTSTQLQTNFKNCKNEETSHEKAALQRFLQVDQSHSKNESNHQQQSCKKVTGDGFSTVRTAHLQNSMNIQIEDSTVTLARSKDTVVTDESADAISLNDQVLNKSPLNQDLKDGFISIFDNAPKTHLRENKQKRKSLGILTSWSSREKRVSEPLTHFQSDKSPELQVIESILESEDFNQELPCRLQAGNVEQIEDVSRSVEEQHLEESKQIVDRSSMKYQDEESVHRIEPINHAFNQVVSRNQDSLILIGSTLHSNENATQVSRVNKASKNQNQKTVVIKDEKMKQNGTLIKTPELKAESKAMSKKPIVHSRNFLDNAGDQNTDQSTFTYIKQGSLVKSSNTMLSNTCSSLNPHDVAKSHIEKALSTQALLLQRMKQQHRTRQQVPNSFSCDNKDFREEKERRVHFGSSKPRFDAHSRNLMSYMGVTATSLNNKLGPGTYEHAIASPKNSTMLPSMRNQTKQENDPVRVFIPARRHFSVDQQNGTPETLSPGQFSNVSSQVHSKLHVKAQSFSQKGGYGIGFLSKTQTFSNEKIASLKSAIQEQIKTQKLNQQLNQTNSQIQLEGVKINKTLRLQQTASPLQLRKLLQSDEPKDQQEVKKGDGMTYKGHPNIVINNQEQNASPTRISVHNEDLINQSKQQLSTVPRTPEQQSSRETASGMRNEQSRKSLKAIDSEQFLYQVHQTQLIWSQTHEQADNKKDICLAIPHDSSSQRQEVIDKKVPSKDNTATVDKEKSSQRQNAQSKTRIQDQHSQKLTVPTLHLEKIKPTITEQDQDGQAIENKTISSENQQPNKSFWSQIPSKEPLNDRRLLSNRQRKSTKTTIQTEYEVNQTVETEQDDYIKVKEMNPSAFGLKIENKKHQQSAIEDDQMHSQSPTNQMTKNYSTERHHQRHRSQRVINLTKQVNPGPGHYDQNTNSIASKLLRRVKTKPHLQTLEQPQVAKSKSSKNLKRAIEERLQKLERSKGLQERGGPGEYEADQFNISKRLQSPASAVQLTKINQSGVTDHKCLTKSQSMNTMAATTLTQFSQQLQKYQASPVKWHKPSAMSKNYQTSSSFLSRTQSNKLIIGLANMKQSQMAQTFSSTIENQSGQENVQQGKLMLTGKSNGFYKTSLKKLTTCSTQASINTAGVKKGKQLAKNPKKHSIYLKVQAQKAMSSMCQDASVSKDGILQDKLTREKFGSSGFEKKDTLELPQDQKNEFKSYLIINEINPTKSTVQQPQIPLDKCDSEQKIKTEDSQTSPDPQSPHLIVTLPSPEKEEDLLPLKPLKQKVKQNLYNPQLNGLKIIKLENANEGRTARNLTIKKSLAFSPRANLAPASKNHQGGKEGGNKKNPKRKCIKSFSLSGQEFMLAPRGETAHAGPRVDLDWQQVSLQSNPISSMLSKGGQTLRGVESLYRSTISRDSLSPQDLSQPIAQTVGEQSYQSEYKQNQNHEANSVGQQKSVNFEQNLLQGASKEDKGRSLVAPHHVISNGEIEILDLLSEQNISEESLAKIPILDFNFYTLQHSKSIANLPMPTVEEDNNSKHSSQNSLIIQIDQRTKLNTIIDKESTN